MICQFRGSWHTYPPFVFKLSFEPLVFSHVYFVSCVRVFCGIRVLQGDKIGSRPRGSLATRDEKNILIFHHWRAHKPITTPDA